jgi:hypothetical protein
MGRRNYLRLIVMATIQGDTRVGDSIVAWSMAGLIMTAVESQLEHGRAYDRG